MRLEQPSSEVGSIRYRIVCFRCRCHTEVGRLPPMSLFRNEENKEMETRAAIEVNALRASESSSGFDELAEQLEDEMGCGLYCR